MPRRPPLVQVEIWMFTGEPSDTGVPADGFWLAPCLDRRSYWCRSRSRRVDSGIIVCNFVV